MKKKLLLILLLILSVFTYKGVNAKVADVSIKNVQLVEKEGLTEEVSTVSYSGMNIKYNVIFKQPNDKITYKVTIKNEGVEDIYINSKGELSGNENVIYDYKWDNNENIIKGYSEKTFAITITYNKAIEDSKFSNGTYEEVKNLTIKISDQKGNVLPAKNPKTDSNLSIFIILLSIEILAVMAVTIYLIKNKKLNIRNLKQMKKTNMVTAGVFLILVLGTIIGYSYALESAEIKLDSKVKISKARLARSCMSDSYAIEHPYNYEILAEESYRPSRPASDDYCLDWEYELYGEEEAIMPSSANLDLYNTQVNTREPYIEIITAKSKTMPEEYVWEGSTYYLYHTSDVSDMQNGEVILGLYGNDDNGLIVIGQDGGVLAPVDSSFLFGSSVIAGMNRGLGTSTYGANDSSIDYDYIMSKPKLAINMIKPYYNNPMVYISGLDLSNIDFQDTNNMSGMFSFNGSYIDSWYLNGIKTWNTENVKDMSIMFAGVGNNNSIVYDLNTLNTSQVEDMFLMFKMAFNYSTSLDISSWDVSNVKDMSGMFLYAVNSLPKLNISSWNVSNVEDMGWMFLYSLNNASSFNISNWDTSNVRNMSCMFSNSLNSINNFNISKWNTSNVDNMEGMFANSLSNVSKFDISKWDTSKVRKMHNMFNQAFNENEIELYINNMDLVNKEIYEGIFRYMSDEAILHVKDENQKEWILDLDNYDRPEAWNEDNIVFE